MERFRLVFQQDKPYPYVFSAERNGEAIDPGDLPAMMIGFWGLVRENSECWRFVGLEGSLERVVVNIEKKNGNYGDIVIDSCRWVAAGRLSFHMTYTAKPRSPEDLPELECMKSHYDGAHLGLSDWYPEIEAGIRAALLKDEPWTTGWYSSKKEIASARISYQNKKILVEASVSDDFDTEGYGSREIEHVPGFDIVDETISQLEDAISGALDEAEENQKGNRTWAMWSIHNAGGAWVETYLMDIVGWPSSSPPGDEYHQWGWQEETDEIPEEVKEELEERLSPWSKESEVKVGDWTAKRVD